MNGIVELLLFLWRGIMAALQALEVFLEMGFGLRWLFSRRYREQLRREENPVWATLQELAVFEGVCVLALVAAILLVGGVTLELTKDQSRVILRRTLRISGIVNLVATGLIVFFVIKYNIWKV